MCKPTTANPAYDTSKLAKDEKWIESFDLAAFTADIKKLGDELEKNQGEEDVRHLNKLVMWSNMCGLVGFLTMGFGVNLLSIVGLSTFTFTRWTMVAHHTCHGGYDKCHPNKGRWNRFKFAIGSFWRRFCDWFDWMMPEAWNVEHNNRHHYNLSEIDDPDLVENNLVDLREANVPLLLKYFVVAINIVTWKWNYYAPNTYKELKLAKLRRQNKPLPKGVDPADAVTLKTIFLGGTPFYSGWELFSIVLGPYFLIHFFLTPLPLLAAGQYLGIEDMYLNAVKNLFLAELFTNAHAFVAIVTNHAGDDMYRFRDGCRPFSGSFYLRQVLASVDFAMGTDIVDFLHGFLNYQIEHHLWPNLSMRSYQKAAPLVRDICAKHGVPYIKQNVFWRVKKTIDIMVGTASMRWFPESYEKEYLKLDALAEASKRAAIKK
uniref:Fatty acid desaturase domain-containing protein n=1 Tax=Helicotheca tamesis TaxID=374047 RepID=A0A7S2H3U5_9STRA|mmetsp:Transcript_15065/g.20507  ORF Transcript_15065/g.20507 Transcript_15065/m.20507 type:complete len:431 (+) Transcript_15065:70-1362(+)|eukprot:CAMPEP_0185726266 /NCGR_PEP_ID=MMETSP1171-20130828/2293_1 /TAXON_ID=374046 /ORGANISM="Helicotheca tamensis, Strain CCMP826" /LENGTH=430 /DNA_ID=CAMNT_0028394583 /DNA_START=64 /DNA_END=1356 /DNA_ORIENTATION=+